MAFRLVQLPPRPPAQRWIPSVAAGPVSETPTPGGAVGAGFGPVAVASAVIGGAVAQGTAPTTRTAVPQGGAVGQGVGPAPAIVPVPQGGAVGAGQAPTARATAVQGGAVGQGVGPSPAVVTFTIGGAVGAGFPPTDSSSMSETPTPGGALAAGIGATARVSTTISGATANGLGPFATVTTPVGGATGQGVQQNTIRVTFTIGGALAGGQLTDPFAVFVTGRFGNNPHGVLASGPSEREFDTPRPRGQS